MADEISVKITGDASGLQDAASQAADSSDQLSEKLRSIQDAADAGTQGLDEAAQSAGAFGSSLESMGEIAAGVFGGLELGKIGEEFKSFFESAIFGAAELGEKLSNLSLSTGISTSTLQELRLAAQLAGGDFDMLQRAISQLSLKMLDLESGGHNAKLETAMADLGLTPAQLEDSEHALDNIAEAIKRVGISERTIGDVSELLGGRGGARFIPVLEKLAEAKKQMADLGLAIDPGQVQANAAAEEKVNLLGAAFGHLKDTISGGLMEALGGVSDFLTRQAVQLSMTATQYDEYTNAIRRGASEMDALKAGMTVGSASARGMLGTGIDGPAAEEMLQPGTQSQTQLKAQFEQTVSDYEASQKEIMAAAGDTAEARITYEKSVRDFLISSKKEAAAAGVDLSKQIATASVAEAAAQNAAAKESAAGWKASALEVQKYIQEQAKMQLDALDEMYSGPQGFKQLATDTLDHVKQKWGELDAAEQKSVQDLKDNAEVIASAFTPITSAFETAFNGVIQGTQTVSQAWKKMLDSMALELLKSGLHDLLLGGAKNTLGASIFGTTGQGGGIAGQIAQAMGGTAVVTSLKNALTTAWQDVESFLKSIFTSIFSGAASGAGSAAGSAVGGAASNTTLTQLVAQGATGLTQDAAYYAQSMAQFIAMVAADIALLAKPSALGFTFAGGGIVPGGSVGVPALLHPNEMVLDSNLSNFVQRAAAMSAGGGGGGGDTYNISFNISALDGQSAHRVIMQNSDSIAQAVTKSLRGGKGMGQDFAKGYFRR